MDYFSILDDGLLLNEIVSKLDLRDIYSLLTTNQYLYSIFAAKKWCRNLCQHKFNELFEKDQPIDNFEYLCENMKIINGGGLLQQNTNISHPILRYPSLENVLEQLSSNFSMRRIPHGNIFLMDINLQNNSVVIKGYEYSLISRKIVGRMLPSYQPSGYINYTDF